MANPSKAKGTAAETAVARLAERHDIPAIRPALSGAQDKGDVWLWPLDGGARVVVEVKNRPSEFAHIPSWPLVQSWHDQAEVEAARTPHADVAVLVVKPHGVGYGNVCDWLAWVTASDLIAWSLGIDAARYSPLDGIPGMWPLGSLLRWLKETR